MKMDNYKNARNVIYYVINGNQNNIIMVKYIYKKYYY